VLNRRNATSSTTDHAHMVAVGVAVVTLVDAELVMDAAAMSKTEHGTVHSAVASPII